MNKNRTNKPRHSKYSSKISTAQLEKRANRLEKISKIMDIDVLPSWTSWKKGNPIKAAKFGLIYLISFFILSFAIEIIDRSKLHLSYYLFFSSIGAVFGVISIMLVSKSWKPSTQLSSSKDKANVKWRVMIGWPFGVALIKFLGNAIMPHGDLYIFFALRMALIFLLTYMLIAYIRFGRSNAAIQT